MILLAANNANSSLSSAISATDTTLTVIAGDAAKFPVPSSGISYFMMTLTDSTSGSRREVVLVTAVSGDTFTITRAQEGTAAQNWAAGDLALNLFTAGSFGSLAQIDSSGQLTNVSGLGALVSTPAAAASTLLSLGGLSVATSSLSVDLNTLGALSSRGIYFQSSAGSATTANHYPETAAGTLLVLPGLFNGCSQTYITSTNHIWTRALTATWNSGSPSWASWQRQVNASELSADSGSSLVGMLQQFSGGVSRTQQQKNTDTVTIDDFLASGASDATAAFNAAVAVGRVIHIPADKTYTIVPTAAIALPMVIDGVLNINASVTISGDITVRGSGRINAGSGFTLTMTGSITAGFKKIFYGAGSIVGLRYVRPEWWGAVGNLSTDCTSALNAASACVAASTSYGRLRPCIELGGGQFLTTGTWTVPASANIGIEVKGQGSIFSGTRIVPSATFSGTAAMYIAGLTDTVQQIVDISLHDFGIVAQTPGSGPANGLLMGTVNASLFGLRESPIQDLFISGFANCMQFLNCRQFQIVRCGIWNDNMTTASNCVSIVASGAFCGDLTFHNVQTVNDTTVANSRGFNFNVSAAFNSTTRANQLAGVRITECILYPADQTIYGSCANGGYLQDIFISNCQFDGSNNTMVSFTSGSGASIVSDIQINNNYMYGGNLSSSRSQVEFLNTGSGALRNVRLEGNTLGNGIGRAINFFGTISNVHLKNNSVIDFSSTTSPAIEISGTSTGFSIIGNMASTENAKTFPYFIQIDSAAAYCTVIGNQSNGLSTGGTIRNLSAASTNIVANNGTN